MPTVLCPEGAVRLIDGDIEQEGRMEVCSNGIWGSICSYGWGTSDAYVACKQLGYNPGIGVLELFVLKSKTCILIDFSSGTTGLTVWQWRRSYSVFLC